MRRLTRAYARTRRRGVMMRNEVGGRSRVDRWVVVATVALAAFTMDESRAAERGGRGGAVFEGVVDVIGIGVVNDSSGMGISVVVIDPP
jgi:hypothetical protein